MNAPVFRTQGDDPESWTVEEYVASPGRAPLSVTISTEGEPPTADCQTAVVNTLARVDALVLQSAALILENYSHDYFKNLGIDESRLPAEEIDAIAAAITLEDAWFHDPEAGAFELSFSAPWDDHHSFDVEFENGTAVTCAVNG